MNTWASYGAQAGPRVVLAADARRAAGARRCPARRRRRSAAILSLSWQHLLAFLFAVGLLVTVHEFGHYWVARRLGFKVLRFSVGFGKALWQRTVAAPTRTEYVLAAIPLGGYVKLLDEREGPVEPPELHRAFNRRPHWQRILVLLAGPAFNIVFAILLLRVLFWSTASPKCAPVRRRRDRRIRPRRARSRRRATRSSRSTASASTGQRDVVLGLLDSMSDDGRASSPASARPANGAERSVRSSG